MVFVYSWFHSFIQQLFIANYTSENIMLLIQVYIMLLTYYYTEATWKY